MIAFTLSLLLTEMDQGVYEILKATTDTQEFKFPIPVADYTTKLVFRIENDNIMSFIVCKKEGIDCTNTPADIAYGPRTVKTQTTYNTNLAKGYYYMRVTCEKVEMCTGNFTVDTAIVLEDHVTLEVTPQIHLITGLNQAQIMLFSCPDKDLKSQLTTIVNDKAFNQQTFNFYLSVDPAIGFPNSKACVANEKTKCRVAVEDFTDMDLPIGLWRITLQFGNQKAVKMLMSQTKFIGQNTDGIASWQTISNVDVCSAYVKLDVSDINVDIKQSYIYALSAVAAHTIAAKDGAVNLKVASTPDFATSLADFGEGEFMYKQGDSVYDLQTLKNAKINTLYIRLSQADSYMIHQAGDIKMTTASLVASYNMLPAQVGKSVRAQLKAIKVPVQSQPPQDQEAGIRRFGYNFYFNQPSVKTTNPMTQLNRLYAFRTLVPNDVAINNYVDWRHLGTEKSHLGATTEFKSDHNWKGVHTVIQTGATSDPDKDIVAYGESLFSTIILSQTDTTVPDKYYPMLTTAGTIIETRGETKLEFDAEHNKGAYQYYLKLHPTNAINEKQGWHFMASSVCNSDPNNIKKDLIQLSYSFVNPLADEADCAAIVSNQDLGNTDGSVDLVVPDKEGRDIYVSMKVDGNCNQIFFESVPIGQNVMKLAPDAYHKNAIEGSYIDTYEFNINGSKYNQRLAYLNVRIPSKIQAQGEYTLQYAIVNELFLGSALDAPDRIKLASGFLNPSKDKFEEIITFSNRQSSFLYLIVSRHPLDPNNNENTEFEFQITHPQLLMNSDTVLVPEPTLTATYAVMDVGRTDDVQFTFEGSEDLKNMAKIYLVPFLPPFNEQAELDKYSLHSFEVNHKSVERLQVDDLAHKTGKLFMIVVFNMAVMTEKSMFITTEVNRRIPLSHLNEIKMDGEGASYATTKLLSNGDENSLVVLTLAGCDNCAICASYSNVHARLVPFSNDLTRNPDCVAIVGRIAQEYEDKVEKKTYPLQAKFQYRKNGYNQLFLTIISNDAEGIVEQVDFVVDMTTQSGPDLEIPLTMKYSEDYEGRDDDTNELFYSVQNFGFVLPCKKLQRLEYSSITVTPDIAKVTLGQISQSFFHVYASATEIIPSYSRDSQQIHNEQGITVLTIKNSELLANCPANPKDEIVRYYVQVRASDQLNSLTPIKVLFSLTNDTNIIYPLYFSHSNYQRMNAGKVRNLFHFDVVVAPISFTLSACRGFPQLRAGITDYYMRSTYTSPDFNNQAERVWKSQDVKYGDDITFRVSPGATLSFFGDYIFEVADWRDDAKLQWSADFYAGNADPRPGIPVSVLEFGYKKNYKVRFTPGIPLGKNLGQTDLQYEMYLLPSFGADQSQSFNPHQACGFKLGGISLNKAPKTFANYADKYYMESDISQADIDNYVKMYSMTTKFYVTVVVTQKDTELSKAYKSIEFDINNPPGDLSNGNKNGLSTGAAVGIAIGIVSVILITVLIIWLVRRQKAKNPYEFVTTK
ncbi:Conserved_hypothetical protein [Hexamita inflata]|uniref:Uncharacterized protein n=1 Tax=Hexamita inflata TaxID=28002 RepID=A0AA86Q5X9_9EUKA|nr:Conserved hypothetical protein [Hexamita inflata]